MYTKAMALFIRQNDTRSELQNRVATELREKLRTQQQIEYEKPENNIEQTTHESENLGPIVIMVMAIVFLGIAYLLLSR